MTNDEWRAHCEAMEAEHPSLHDFLETWGKHCGAPRAVFRGHLCKMIDAIWAEASPTEAVERDAARWRSMQIVMDCITAVERHQMDESQFFGAVVEAFENAMRPGDIHSESGGKHGQV